MSTVIKEAVESAERAGDPRVVIEISDDRFNAIVCQCAVLLNDTIYLRGAVPFAVTRALDVGGQPVDDQDGAGVELAGVRHRPGSLIFTGATPERAAFQLDDRVRFLRPDLRSKTSRAVTCPTKVAQRIIAVAPDLGFRPCCGVSRTPLLLDGMVIAEPGWNGRTGLLLDPPAGLPPIPGSPSRTDAERALEVLLRPFRGYLADSPALRPLLAAAALTAALRTSLPAAPAIVLDGNTVGVGKGKCARALAVLATGTLPAMIAEGHNDEETDKRIAAAILQGAPAILLDNLQRVLASTTLESILTDPIARIRKFGSLSDDVVTECRALVLLTANNAALRRDLLRRTLPIRLVVAHEKPELRKFDFDPVDEINEGRSELLAAALTIAKAWHLVRAQPEHAKIRARTLGSFEVWADLVAGAVEWLTGSSPIEAIEKNKDNDSMARAEVAAVTQLARVFGGAQFTTSEAAAKIDPEVWRAVMQFKGERPDGRAVGNWFRWRRDRHFSIEIAPNVFRLIRLATEGVDRKGFALWQIAGCRSAQKTAENCEKSPGMPNVPNVIHPHAREIADNFPAGGSNTFGDVRQTRRTGGANGDCRERVGICASCRFDVFADNAVTTAAGAVMHPVCARGTP